jgi:DNA polymerase III subunit epsilon
MNQQTQDRNAAILWARSIFDRAHEYFILDTETTGLDNPEVIELAIIDPSGLMVINQRFKPKAWIEPGATKIHGITNEMLHRCPEWSVVADRLTNILTQRTLLIYNARFDNNAIFNSYNAHVVYHPLLDSQCVMQWYSQFVGDWNEYRGGYRWQKLPNGDHSALGDCLATLEVLKRMANSSLAEESKSIDIPISLAEVIEHGKKILSQ